MLLIVKRWQKFVAYKLNFYYEERNLNWVRGSSLCGGDSWWSYIEK